MAFDLAEGRRRFGLFDLALIAGLMIMAALFAWLFWHKGSGLQSEAEASVRRLLKDPDSAKFERVQASDASQMVCGFVNGKNGFGGYVGFRPFFYTPGAGAYILTKDDDLVHWRNFFDKCPERVT